MVTWKEAKKDLQRGVVRTVFVKKSNGNLREMYCTRNPDVIAIYEGYEGDDMLGEDERSSIESQYNTNTLKVFDLVKEAFRTISLDNVVEETFELFKDTKGREWEADVPGWVAFDPGENWRAIMDDEDLSDNIAKYTEIHL